MQKKINIPEGSSVVLPYLTVNSVEKEIEFLKEVFEAELKDSVKAPDGLINHAEINIGGCSIMIGKASPKFPQNESMIYVYVQNADEAYDKALRIGAESVMKPDDRFYGNREGGVKDMHGNTWWIAQFIRTVSSEEIAHAMAEMAKQQS